MTALIVEMTHSKIDSRLFNFLFSVPSTFRADEADFEKKKAERADVAEAPPTSYPARCLPGDGHCE